MNRSTGRILRIGLALTLGILAVNATYSYWNIRQIAEHERWVTHTQEFLAATSGAFLTLRDAENGLRGYIITGDPTYLEPYLAAVVSIRDDIDRLRRFAGDNPAQRARIDVAQEHIHKRLALLKECLRLYRKDGVETARQFLLGAAARQEVGTLRASFDAIEAEETGLLRVRTAAARRAYTGAVFSIAISAAVSLALIGLINATAGWSIAARARAETLQEADRRKDEFLAQLAHELRNPLSAIRAALESLFLNMRRDPGVRGAGEAIDNQVQHISRLIEDLLDASRIAQGKLDLRCELLDLMEAVDLAIEISRPMIEARGHQLLVERPPAALSLNGDRARLAQIFANLLVNAAKYSPRASRIWLAAACEDGQAVVRVRDEGQGVAPEMLPKLFGLYTQEERVQEDAAGGLGIGLSLVRHLAELHGGTVEARSEGPGRGSEFTIRLPLTQASPVSSEAAGRAEGLAAAPSRPRRILLADDNSEFAEMYAQMLESRGHDVRVAHDGASAVEMTREFGPDVILTDIGLPELDGFEVARRLRSQHETSEVLLIALSGRTGEEDRRRAMEAGFDHYLTKPVRFAEVERLLVSQQRLRQTAGAPN